MRQHRPELETVTDINGRFPIFFIEVSAKWRTDQRSKKFDPIITKTLVYKGMPKPRTQDREKIVKDFLLKTFKSKEVSVTIKQTFTITEFKLLEHLGHENAPGLD